MSANCVVDAISAIATALPEDDKVEVLSDLVRRVLGYARPKTVSTRSGSSIDPNVSLAVHNSQANGGAAGEDPLAVRLRELKTSHTWPELARIFSVNESTVRAWVTTGHVPKASRERVERYFAQVRDATAKAGFDLAAFQEAANGEDAKVLARSIGVAPKLVDELLAASSENPVTLSPGQQARLETWMDHQA